MTFDLSPPSSPLMRSDAALIIFAKAPIPGQVKTRLCPPLTPDEAASLHGSIVLDILERSKPVRGLDRFLGCAPSKEHPFFKTLAARHGVQLWDQAVDLASPLRGTHVVLHGGVSPFTNAHIIFPDTALVANSAAGMDTEALDFIGNVGADQPGTVVFVGADGVLLTGSIADAS